MKVLLIQHQNHARRLFRHLLGRQDCVVSESASLELAASEYRRGPFDIVFVDEPLPDTKPLEVIRRLRANEATADAVIVALVGRSYERDLSGLVAAGADEYMVLPAPLEEVQLRLGIILGWTGRASRASVSASIGGQTKDRFFDSLPDAAVLLDRVGTVVAANARLAALTGYTVPQLIGQPAEFIGLPMAEEMPDLLEEAASARDKLEHVTLVRRDMKPVPAVIRYAWLDPEVRTIVVGVARETGETGEFDETESPQVRPKSGAPSFLEFDRQGIIKALNRSLADLLEISRDQVIGTSLRNLIHREDLAGIARIMAPTSGPGGEMVEGTLRLRSGDGDWMPLELVGTALNRGETDERFRLQVAKDVRGGDVSVDVRDTPNVDSLTGLPHRDAFVEYIRQAYETDPHGGPIVVLFLNLDRFKVINERHGYAVGDKFIAEVAARLKKLVTFTDVVGRVGGDEFAILPGAASSHAEAMDIAERIANDLANRPIQVGAHEQFLTASIGIALAEPATISPADLLRQADGAAVQAKSDGRGKIQIYESALEKIKSDSLNLEQELLQALKRDELVVYYQPEVDLNTGRIAGVEALIRWNHPIEGLVEPSRFIPTAEDSGLIDPIGLWVLERASMDVSSWISKFGLRDFGLSVNYSAYQFRGDNLLMEMSSALRRAGLPPSALRVEITESVLIEDEPEIVRRLEQIRRLGAHLAIDDFGTGRASISYLRSLPVDFLKVDRSFVSGASAQSGELSLTRSIASLAREAGLQVVVEGIETAKQLQRVKEIGCHRGQGYYFSRPVAAATVEFLLMAGAHPFAGVIEMSEADQPASSSTFSS